MHLLSEVIMQKVPIDTDFWSFNLSCTVKQYSWHISAFFERLIPNLELFSFYFISLGKI